MLALLGPAPAWAAGGGAFPWETMLQKLVASVTGPVAGGIGIGGQATITRTKVSDNTATAFNVGGQALAVAGGISDEGSLTLTDSSIERNRVNISIAVDEGEIAKIHSIDFTGNTLFSDRTLRSTMELTTPNWLSWYTKRDQYSRQKLSADLETLRSFYLTYKISY